MLNDQQEILIRKYFRQELEREDQQAFNNYLSEDPEFRDTVQHQKILQEGLEMLSLREELKYLMNDLPTEEARQVPLWKRSSFIGIAASILLFAVITSYAGYKLGWFKGWLDNPAPPKNEKTIPADSLKSGAKEGKSISSLNYGMQQVSFNPAVENEISGGLGTIFNFPAASLTESNGRIIRDSVHLELIEVLDADELSKMAEDTPLEDEHVLKVFYILPYYSKGPVEINNLAPPMLLLPEDQDVVLWFGGDDRTKVDWRMSSSGSAELISEPTPSMENYMRFIEGMAFLDSLESSYILRGEAYESKNGGGMKYTASFVEDVRNYVNDYRADKYFKEKMIKAQQEWKVYSEQHTLQSLRQEKKKENIKRLYAPGWYAVVEK